MTKSDQRLAIIIIIAGICAICGAFIATISAYNSEFNKQMKYAAESLKPNTEISIVEPPANSDSEPTISRSSSSNFKPLQEAFSGKLLDLSIEPKLYLYNGNAAVPSTLVKVGPVSEVPVGCGMILELNISNINSSSSHTIKTASFSTYEGNFNPKPTEWSMWGTLYYQEQIPSGLTEKQVNIAGVIVGLAGWWIGKKKVEIYWDEKLVDTFYFDTVPRKNN